MAYLSNILAPKSGGSFRTQYHSILKEILKLLDMELKQNGTIMSLLESLKNSMIGKPHLPHSHMIDYGIHALTVETIFSQKQAQNEMKKGSTNFLKEE